MSDEHPTRIRFDGEQPPIAVGTAVNFSRPNGHGGICSLFPQPYSSGGRSATPAGQGPQIQTEVLPKPAFAASTPIEQQCRRFAAPELAS